MSKSFLQPTNYAWLSIQVNTLVEELALGNYASCVASLLAVKQAEFPALTQGRNPVVANIESWTRNELRFIIEEYSGFSNAAIHLFLEARIRNHWPDLTKEIVRNMDEEMGALTRGIPHLELMRHGYRVELGIETDGLQHTAMTNDFINRMSAVFRAKGNKYLAGGLLAFETTAVDEFRIVDRMLRRYKEILGGSITPDSLTGRYIAGHVAPATREPRIDPEMDHHRGMVEAVGANAGDGDMRPLVRGFLSVCLELNRWWEQVASEAFRKEIHDQLGQEGEEPPDVYPTMRQGLMSAHT